MQLTCLSWDSWDRLYSSAAKYTHFGVCGQVAGEWPSLPHCYCPSALRLAVPIL